jgi:transcriptional regulator with XRE-family HTH domain
VHVGERIRQRRAVLDLSLDVVASRIGVSPQQLQKYEAADNRITAGRLFTCATALDVPVSFFFDGLTDGREDSTTDPRASSSSVRAGQVSVDEVGELLRLYSSIVDHDIRRRAIEYIRSLAPGAKKTQA